VMFKSPLRYPGGKTRAIKLLEQYVPYGTTTIVSPFFGGGSFELYMCGKGMNVIANDKFNLLINFWNQCKQNKQELIDQVIELKSTFTKEEFDMVRKTIKGDSRDIKSAAYFFAINRSSFSGATFSGGFSKQALEKRFTENSIKNLKCNLDQIEFYCFDFLEFLQKVENCKNYWYFCDPPYYLDKGKNNLYGNNGNLHENFDHIKFADCIKKKKNWIVCYNDCNFIRQLYKEYKIVELKWEYGMTSNESSEIVIIYQT
jgi:DNA adenine methylase